MASLITHPLVPIAIAVVAGRKVIPAPLAIAGVVLAMLPDADSVAFRLGIPYSSQYGHRGFTHSIVMAAACALALVPLARAFGATRIATFGFAFVAMLSHGVLDACTNKGNGVAFLWPFTNERFFFGFRPIEASPVSVQRFLTVRGWDVLQSELVWVWAPLLAVMVVGYGVRKLVTSRISTPSRPRISGR